MTARYRYSADGVKLEAKVSSGALNAPAGQPTAYAYLGSLVYSKAESSYQLESTDFSGGRIVPGDTQCPIHYHIADHLGSVRAVVWPEEGSDGAVILEQNDYYPYGLRMDNGLTASTDNLYRFSGKETQPLMGGNILDFGARYYYPTIARWTTIDPKAEKYYSTTPYSYCNNSPVVYVDPDGEVAQVVVGAAVGALFNVGVAICQQKSMKEIGVAALTGAIEGGIGAVTFGVGGKVFTKVVKDVVMGAIGSAVGSTTEQMLTNNSVDGSEVLKDAIIGGISGGFGGAVQNTFRKNATKAVSSETHKAAVISEIKHENRIYGIPNGRNVSKSADNIIESQKDAVKDAAPAVGAAVSTTVAPIIDEMSEKVCNR